MPSWPWQWVKERFIVILLVIRWQKCKVFKQRSLLAIPGAELKSEERSESRIWGLFSVFQAFLPALKDTRSQELQCS